MNPLPMGVSFAAGFIAAILVLGIYEIEVGNFHAFRLNKLTGGVSLCLVREAETRTSGRVGCFGLPERDAKIAEKPRLLTDEEIFGE